MKNLITKFTKWILTESLGCHKDNCHANDEYADEFDKCHREGGRNYNVFDNCHGTIEQTCH